jgi:hypothetical protein
MGRLLQVLGCVLMLAAVSAAVGRVNRADAEILAPIARAIQVAEAALQQQTPGPEPTPTPAPTPKPAALVHGGPLTFSISGSLSMGDNAQTSTTGQGVIFTPSPSPAGSATPGPFPFQQAQTTAQTESEVGAGLNADISRRTATTMTDLRVPFGYATNGQSTVGTPQFLYSTPEYSLGYGSQQLLALGQLQMGSTLRGFTFILPQHYGQTTFYSGPALGAEQELVRLDGILMQQVRGRALYEAGFVYASGPATGSAKTFEFGTATAGRNLSMILEGAWQSRSGGDGSPHGVAFQTRLDDFSQSGACSTTLRSVPDQFVTFSAGEIFSDRYADFNCHGTNVPAYFDANWEKTGDAINGVNEQVIETLGYSPSIKKIGGISFNLQHQTGSSDGMSLLSNAGSVALSTSILRTSALLGAQLQRTDSGGSVDATQSLSASLRHAIGYRLSVGVTGQEQRQSLLAGPPSPQAMATPSAIVGPALTLQRGVAFDISQQWRRTTVQLSETITRTTSSTSDALQRTPLVSISRVISPVISATTSLGYQVLTDAINPAANGRSRVFSVTLTAPFSYGNANVAGRVDPRLPATIAGKVLVAGTTATGSGASPSFATFAGSGGVANVLVTLDGKYVQRTDVTGGFQFSFVSPGQHQVTIDNSSIPSGFTAAVPVQTVVVQGGQLASVSFSIGTFGGILGHVYGSDASGNPIPLSNVQLRVDGGAYSQTDSSGAFGFGGLSAGQHEVTVIPNSIPASANFATADLTRKVSVSDGRYTTLDFHAELLGSIAGTILYGKDMDQQAGQGVLNAYVVAEPGEHAAIDEDDGSFIIDNLPAGDYTLSVDPETIGEGLGAAPDTVTVHLGAGEHYSGIQFLVGRFEKKVVFSLLSSSATPAPAVPTVHLSETQLPPRGTTTVAINAPADASDVSATAFGKRIALVYDKSAEKWVGEIEVPLKAVEGEYPVSGTIRGKAVEAGATLKVDPAMPLVIVQILPRNAGLGQTATVRARFLVDVHAGETIAWSDGTQTILDKPITGRVFTFRKQLTLLPLHGVLLTPNGPIPIVLL